MAAFSQLVELTSADVVDDVESLDEALDELGQAVDQYSAEAMGTYSLLELDEAGGSLVAMEGDLLALVARHRVEVLASA